MTDRQVNILKSFSEGDAQEWFPGLKSVSMLRAGITK